MVKGLVGGVTPEPGYVSAEMNSLDAATAGPDTVVRKRFGEKSE